MNNKKIIWLGATFFVHFISGVMATIFASGKIDNISTQSVTTVLLALQWQVFALIIVKGGLDQIIFALISVEKNHVISLRGFIVSNVVPFALVFFLIFWSIFGIYIGLFLALSVILDGYSVVRVSENNARGRYGVVLLANFLNFPIFYAFVFFTSAISIDENIILAGFLGASLLRSVYLYSISWLSNFNGEKNVVEFETNWMTYSQPILNHLLFRFDQILLSLLLSLNIFIDKNSKFVLMYLYMTKFVELFTAFCVVLGNFYFPTINISSHSDLLEQAKLIIRKRGILIFGAIGFLVIIIFFYRDFFSEKIMAYFLIPFLFQCILILPANLITFSMLRQGKLQQLINNLIKSIICGGFAFFALFYMFELKSQSFLWMICIQNLSFMYFAANFDWGNSIGYIKAKQ